MRARVVSFFGLMDSRGSITMPMRWGFIRWVGFVDPISDFPRERVANGDSLGGFLVSGHVGRGLFFLPLRGAGECTGSVADGGWRRACRGLQDSGSGRNLAVGQGKRVRK